MRTYISVTTDTPFINPWDRRGTIGAAPVRVPMDGLCRAMLGDGSLRIVEEKTGPRTASTALEPQTVEGKNRKKAVADKKETK